MNCVCCTKCYLAHYSLEMKNFDNKFGTVRRVLIISFIVSRCPVPLYFQIFVCFQLYSTFRYSTLSLSLIHKLMSCVGVGVHDKRVMFVYRLALQIAQTCQSCNLCYFVLEAQLFWSTFSLTNFSRIFSCFYGGVQTYHKHLK